MEGSVSSFEHEAKAEYLDPSLGGTHWGSLPPATQGLSHNSFNFTMLGDLNHTPTQNLADSTFDDAMNETENYPQLPSTGSSHLETHHQGFSQQQSGPQSVSVYYNSDLVDNGGYTQFSGVYSPEKLSSADKDPSKELRYHCPRCDSKFATRSDVKGHFLLCIDKNGNPDGLRWNNHISVRPRPETGIKDKARNDRFHDALKAYSGVVIPSKLPQGTAIIKYVSKGKQGPHLCAVCGGGPFLRPYHVQSHFISCVKRHGNPSGANWYDRLDLKHIGKRSSKRRDTIAKTPSTIRSPPRNTPDVPYEYGDHPSSSTADVSNTFGYALAVPQWYQSSGCSLGYSLEYSSGYQSSGYQSSGCPPTTFGDTSAVPLGYKSSGYSSGYQSSGYQTSGYQSTGCPPTFSTSGYAPAVPQGYQSSGYPPTSALGYGPAMSHGNQLPLSAEYPPIPFGYAPAWPQESQPCPPVKYR